MDQLSSIDQEQGMKSVLLISDPAGGQPSGTFHLARGIQWYYHCGSGSSNTTSMLS
jgi:hypothetical protein